MFFCAQYILFPLLILVFFVHVFDGEDCYRLGILEDYLLFRKESSLHKPVNELSTYKDLYRYFMQNAEN